MGKENLAHGFLGRTLTTITEHFLEQILPTLYFIIEQKPPAVRHWAK